MRILFTPLIAGKPWNGKTLATESLGGSESAVAYLAKALRLRGHECVVYTHGQAGFYDAVEYRNVHDIQNAQQEQWDVHIVPRWTEAVGLVPNAITILWIHDIIQYKVLHGDAIVFLTDWHAAACLSNPKQEGIEIIGNGVNLGDFLGYVPWEKRIPGKMVWTSNPDRGLNVAGRIFKRLRAKHPGLTLHVYGRAAVYGWGMDAEVPYYPRQEEMDGIVFHEPLPKKQLAEELKTAWAFFYPATWPETFCIATLEAQAAGLPCIVPPYGALQETVRGGIITYDFDNAVERLLDKAEWERLSMEGRRYATDCSWDKRAQEWERVIENAKPRKQNETEGRR